MSEQITWKDERTGITGRSNGSEAGNSFMSAFIQADKEMRTTEAEIIKDLQRLGAVALIPWDGWFCLESNNYKSGSGAVGTGSKARFQQAFGKHWGALTDGAIIGVRPSLMKPDVTLWRITGRQKPFLSIQWIDLEFIKSLP